jgi:hypothetical protein
MKPEFVLIDWSRGSVVGLGTEAECREQLTKAASNNDNYRDVFLVCEVKTMSEMQRVES